LNPCIGYCQPRHRKRKADDAGEPLVEIVLVLRLFGLDDLIRRLAGPEFCPPALGQVAGEAPSLTLPRMRGRVREGASCNRLIWSGVQPCGRPISASGIEPSP
jgi:hypothetical protein